ncbi:hypothetical protein ABMA28_003515 [Loxostege sticticalis]|uniref:Uncharacterized protein n=1 Tax=Loxostege sticticalis TaxID=481309 RepID=A0ABD0SWB4_LOXSC
MSEDARVTLARSLWELEGFLQRLEGLAHEGWGIVRTARHNVQRLYTPPEFGDPTTGQTDGRSPAPPTAAAPPTALLSSSSTSSTTESSSSDSEPGASGGDGDDGVGRRHQGERGRCPRLPSYSSVPESPAPGSPARLSPPPDRTDLNPTSIHDNTTILPSSRSDSPVSSSLISAVVLPPFLQALTSVGPEAALPPSPEPVTSTPRPALVRPSRRGGQSNRQNQPNRTGRPSRSVEASGDAASVVQWSLDKTANMRTKQCVLCRAVVTNQTKRHFTRHHKGYIPYNINHPNYPKPYFFYVATPLLKCPSALRPSPILIRIAAGIDPIFLDMT